MASKLLFLFISIGSAQAAVPMSEDACKRLSEGAKISGTKALIIGYEGLFSSSPINANLLSNYREKLATGQKAHRPLYAFGGSFLVRGPLTRVVENYKNKVQVLVFGRTGKTDANSIPGKCATIWMQDKGEGTEGRKVIIVGHSFGGGAAWELANSLRSRNVTVDGVVTADPRSPKQCMGECWSWAKPSNVTVWSNHYQRAPLRGHEVPGASNNYHAGYSHGTIQNAPAFYQAIANRIDGVSGPITVARPIYTRGNEKAGQNGSLNTSTISGAASPDAGGGPPPGKQQGAAAPVNPPSNSILAALARNSPSRSRDEEEKWFQRASASDSSTGGSGLAKKVENSPSVFTYFKPGSGPDLRSSGRSLSGSSRPGNAGASAPAAGSSFAGASGQILSGDTAMPAGGTTGMLNTLWPLSKGEASLPAAAAGPGFSSGSSNSSGPGLDSLDGPGSSLNAGASFSSSDQPGQIAASAAPSIQASAVDQTLASVTLFRRVHQKHEYWFKRRDRF